MITQEQIILFPLSEEEIQTCLSKTKKNFNLAKRDNLRSRHQNIQFDCLLRGYVGEYAVLKWLQNNNIHIDETNIFLEEDNMDIDFSYKQKNFELKTSLIPDVDKTIERTIAIRDIKLIKRSDSIEELKGDIHLQIFFNQKRRAKDEWLKQQKIQLDSDDLRYLYQSLLAKAYLNTTYFVGWIDKETAVARNIALPIKKRTWQFAKREFWVCPIHSSHPPGELISCLDSL